MNKMLIFKLKTTKIKKINRYWYIFLTQCPPSTLAVIGPLLSWHTLIASFRGFTPLQHITQVEIILAEPKIHRQVLINVRELFLLLLPPQFR